MLHEEIVHTGGGPTRPSVKDIDGCGWFIIIGTTALDQNQPSQLFVGFNAMVWLMTMNKLSLPIGLAVGRLVFPRQGGWLGWEEATEGSPGIWVRRPQPGSS